MKRIYAWARGQCFITPILTGRRLTNRMERHIFEGCHAHAASHWFLTLRPFFTFYIPGRQTVFSAPEKWFAGPQCKKSSLSPDWWKFVISGKPELCKWDLATVTRQKLETPVRGHRTREGVERGRGGREGSDRPVLKVSRIKRGSQPFFRFAGPEKRLAGPENSRIPDRNTGGGLNRGRPSLPPAGRTVSSLPVGRWLPDRKMLNPILLFPGGSPVSACFCYSRHFQHWRLPVKPFPPPPPSYPSPPFTLPGPVPPTGRLQFLTGHCCQIPFT